MRKDLADMNDAEKRAELAFQREHFAHLVSDIEFASTSQTRFGRWWREWGDVVVVTTKIVVYTAIWCAVVVGGLWFTITVLAAL